MSVLQEKGFSLITATHGSQGLRLLVSKPVDAVILEYYLGLLDGAAVADEIKKVRPRLPIVMLGKSSELPEGALKSVDAFVTSSDGPRFLLEAINTLPHAKDRQHFDTASVKQAESPGEEAMPNPAKCQILLVDDDQSVRESVAMSLMAAGYDVVATEDGFRALVQLRKKVPDVVLSDLDMPGMSGFELLSVVRRRFPQISTVAMSGAYVGNEVPFGVIADGFYSKGGQSKNLLSTIQRLLLTAPARISDHYRECAPAWIPRNGNDSKAMPYVVLTCAECLREVYTFLGWFKYLAALQATCFVARGDESTKRTHPLRREIAVVCFHSKQLPQRSSDESAQAANTDNERVHDSIHSQLRVSS